MGWKRALAKSSNGFRMFFPALLLFAVGVCVGSFLNVLVFRTRDGEALTGRSRCLTCEKPIAWHDLIPVASFFALRGRCRSCQGVISWQYPLVELVTGVLFLLFYLRYATSTFLPDAASAGNLWLFLLRDLTFSVFLIIVFVYDLRYALILDRFTIPGMIVATILNLWLGLPIWSLLAGGVVLGGFFLFQYLVSRGAWVGDGDIRMGALMGLMLGFRDGMVALFLSYVIGAVFGLFLLATRKATPKTQIPFGTFLSVGALVTLLFGERIIEWYVGLFV